MSRGARCSPSSECRSESREMTMVSDPISDMLARIRNAQTARLERADLPLSKLKLNVAELLKREGYLADVRSEEGTPGKLTVVLKYGQGHQGAIAGMRRRSRPGRRLYVGHTELPKVMNGLGIAHPLHVARRDDRQGCASRASRRRAALRGLVMEATQEDPAPVARRQAPDPACRRASSSASTAPSSRSRDPRARSSASSRRWSASRRTART